MINIQHLRSLEQGLEILAKPTIRGQRLATETGVEASNGGTSNKPMRMSLLSSSLISNSESWVGLTKKNITDLETVDEQLLRKILSAHSKTPKELLYLELGALPVRFILMSRRINFLWYLINDKEESLLKRFFKAQCDQPIRGDWVSTVKQDLAELEINLSFEEIEKISKEAFKDLVKQKVRKGAFEYLQKVQHTHSKDKNLSYNELDLQMYLKSGTNKMTIKEKSFTFALRSRTIDVKCNKLQGQMNVKCRLGCDQDESQPHLLHCSALRDSTIVKELPNYEDIHGNSVQKIETLSKIIQQKFKLFIETAETPQVNSSQASSASASINSCKNNVNIIDAVDLD